MCRVPDGVHYHGAWHSRYALLVPRRVYSVSPDQPDQPPLAGQPNGLFTMLEPKHLDDLASRLAGSLPKGIQALQADIGKNLRASLEAGLARLDLVTREEFDVQAAVLARTREKLAVLEARVAELERPARGGVSTVDTAPQD